MCNDWGKVHPEWCFFEKVVGKARIPLEPRPFAFLSSLQITNYKLQITNSLNKVCPVIVFGRGGFDAIAFAEIDAFE